MSAVPAETPKAMPLEEPMVATAVLAEIHCPPVTVSDKAELNPTQKDLFPVIIEGGGEMVMENRIVLEPATGQLLSARVT
jgi:hypothetical protein